MGGLFKAPKMPKPQEPAPVPQVDEAARVKIEQERLRKRRGRAATIVSTAESQVQGGVGKAKLLGGGY